MSRRRINNWKFYNARGLFFITSFFVVAVVVVAFIDALPLLARDRKILNF